MQWTGKRIFTAVMLASASVTVYQVLSKPRPVTQSQPLSEIRANVQSFEQKLEQVQTSRTKGSAPAEVRFTSDEVSAEMAHAMGALPPDPRGLHSTVTSVPASADAEIAPGEVQVKDYQIKLEGDVARGQFLIRVAGKDIYVTLAGHLGSKDGYVTLDPTEFKVGDLSIPVSLVNSALQKKLMEQREQLRLPENVSSLRIENGELVLTQK